MLSLLRSLARHCSIPREEAEREAAIFIWPPCASLAPLSVTNGQVVNRKKAQKRKWRERHRGKVEIKQHESAIYTFKIQIKSFACRHDERGRRQGQTRQTLTAAATYAMRLTSRESDLLAGWLTFELGLDYFGCSIHLSSLVPWPNLASAQNTKT